MPELVGRVGRRWLGLGVGLEACGVADVEVEGALNRALGRADGE
jgi:hypothetical protein